MHLRNSLTYLLTCSLTTATEAASATKCAVFHSGAALERAEIHSTDFALTFNVDASFSANTNVPCITSSLAGTHTSAMLALVGSRLIDIIRDRRRAVRTPECVDKYTTTNTASTNFLADISH